VLSGPYGECQIVQHARAVLDDGRVAELENRCHNIRCRGQARIMSRPT
jgi:hypothetical protein